MIFLTWAGKTAKIFAETDWLTGRGCEAIWRRKTRRVHFTKWSDGKKGLSLDCKNHDGWKIIWGVLSPRHGWNKENWHSRFNFSSHTSISILGNLQDFGTLHICVRISAMIDWMDEMAKKVSRAPLSMTKINDPSLPVRDLPRKSFETRKEESRYSKEKGFLPFSPCFRWHWAGFYIKLLVLNYAKWEKNETAGKWQRPQRPKRLLTQLVKASGKRGAESYTTFYSSPKHEKPNHFPEQTAGISTDLNSHVPFGALV